MSLWNYNCHLAKYQEKVYNNISVFLEEGKMKKLIILFAATLTAVVCLNSCGKKATQTLSQTGAVGNQAETTQVTLNDWQKSVLEAQELPTEYDKLDVSQQIAIRRMYEMKKYLDDKYGMEFEYAGYIPAGLMEKEQFFAYPKELGTDGGRNYVTVTSDDKGSFTDDYVSAGLRDKFEKMYNDFVQDYFNSDKAVVFVSHFECDYEDFTEMKDDYYENKIYGENQIFISEEICDEKKLKDFNTDYYHWQCSKGTLANTRITVVYADKFKRININNYTDFYNDESILYDSGLTFINNGQYANPQITIYKKDDNGKTVREKEKFDLNLYGKKEYENVNN